MDLKKYISSGILENYVLGLSSEQERLEVEANLVLYPELNTELNAIEKALEFFATSHSVKLPVNLEASIMERIGFDQTPKSSAESSPQTSLVSSSESNVVKYLLCALALCFSLLLSIWFYNQNRNTSNELDQLNENHALLKSDCDKKDAYITSLEEQLQILRAAGSTKVQMNGTDKVPNAIASVIYNPKTKKSYIDVMELPVPTSDKQYQLWAIVDGAPVDMGVFDVVLNENTTFQEVPFIENPQAFAVTLEKKGGNPTPTLEEMVVVGNVISG